MQDQQKEYPQIDAQMYEDLAMYNRSLFTTICEFVDNGMSMSGISHFLRKAYFNNDRLQRICIAAAKFHQFKKNVLEKHKMVHVEIMYRDAANYKTCFSADVDMEQYPLFQIIIDSFESGKDDTQFEMGKFGLPDENDFFDDIHPSAYDPELDHNFFTLVSWQPINTEPDYDNMAQDFIDDDYSSDQPTPYDA